MNKSLIHVTVGLLVLIAFLPGRGAGFSLCSFDQLKQNGELKLERFDVDGRKVFLYFDEVSRAMSHT